MGVATDKTLLALISSVAGIDVSGLMTDATGQAIVTAIENIPGGGGGGSAYSETVLFDNLGAAAPASITLSDDYTNYDMLIFCLLRDADGRYYHYDRLFLASNIAIGDSIQVVAYNEYASYDVTNATTFTQVNSGGLYLDKVVGVKY